MEKEKPARINELARLSKSRALSDAERKEQSLLRQEYLDEIRISFGNTLEHTVIERPDGTRVKLHKKQDLK